MLGRLVDALVRVGFGLGSNPRGIQKRQKAQSSKEKKHRQATFFLGKNHGFPCFCPGFSSYDREDCSITLSSVSSHDMSSLLGHDHQDEAGHRCPLAKESTIC